MDDEKKGDHLRQTVASNTGNARMQWVTYTPACGFLHLSAPSHPLLLAVCPDGVQP